MPGMDAVEVVEGLKADFLKRYRRDEKRADEAWRGLVGWGERLRQDPFAGTQIPKDRFPRRFAEHDNLWKLDLAHAFRAVYSILGRPGQGVRVAIEWIGDHREYERLFGYR